MSTKEKTVLMNTENIAPVLYIQSDCDTASDRDRYVSELMKHIRIDSYGACINNARLDTKYNISLYTIQYLHNKIDIIQIINR